MELELKSVVVDRKRQPKGVIVRVGDQSYYLPLGETVQLEQLEPVQRGTVSVAALRKSRG